MVPLLAYSIRAWSIYEWGFPGGSGVKNSPANAGDVREVGSVSGSGRSPAGQLHSVFLPGESHGQRSLPHDNPWGRTESDTTECLRTWTCQCFDTMI